jgi:7-carboxy-7-deazaguanine synthase
MNGQKFPVMECFGPTIQGEGALAGQRSHFIRFGGCDYRCTWCDSMHAVDPDLVKLNAKWLLPNEIRQELETIQATGGHSNWVTLTGGNPVMWDLSQVVECLQDLPSPSRKANGLGWYINVETQGSEWRDWLKNVEQVTCSPKGPSSGMSDKFSWGKLDKFVKELTRSSSPSTLALKIVIFNEDDLIFAKNIHETYPHVDMYLSVGTDLSWYDYPDGGEKMRGWVGARYSWLAEEVLKDNTFYDVTVFPQLHVLMWPNEKTGR